jgi:hypothetical protein
MKHGWIAGLLALTLTSQANARFFTSFEGKQAPSEGKQVLRPDNYRVEMVDQASLLQFLSKLSADPQKAELITLPTPEGGFRDFYIWKTPILEEPLRTTYSNIQTFTAKAKDNPGVTAKIDYTQRGFHAMIYDGANTSFIDPYADIADGYYIVYYKRDYKRPLSQAMSCGVGGELLPDGQRPTSENADGALPPIGWKQNGATRKQYRLALACTGEYAQAVGGATPTTASVLSAMVTSINRVNGIYERELSVTLTMIGNNDLLVYLDPNTDPFTANNNGGMLLGQNQTNTGSVIGSANYDIGHIFSTGGGGIAGLGCVCRSNGNQKARGVTGSANPVGDPYDVDYVAHEMGHQFGGDHSFNRCSGTEFDLTAFEPGSGSTIMAYAGICGPVNNLQAHSDAYFHTISLDEITDFITTGVGANCPVISAGNTPPVLPSITDTFVIPYRTPFELLSPVATADFSDTITYCWEQWDLGDFQENESGSGSFTEGPSFRSFMPQMERLRVFPRIDSLVKNIIAYRGERLPSVARWLNFKVAARNIYNGYGSFDFSDGMVSLNVINTGQPFTVTSPNAATDTAYRNQAKDITWNVAQTDAAPISTPNVDIFLSVDGGYTYPYTLATGVPNNGAATVTMPDTSSVKARVKVKGAGNVFFDISNADFVLADSGAVVSVDDVTLDNDVLIYPNPAVNQIRVENKGRASALSLILYSAVGQRVWSGEVRKQVTIPVATYARGIYYLKVTDNQKGAQAVKPVTLQ